MSTVLLNNKLSRKVKLAYGSTGFAGMITFNLFLTYSLWFFTEVVGFTATFAGAVIGLGTLWDAITDPLIGAWSDNTKNKKGRRRPFMLGVMFPFAAVTILLFTNLDFGALGTKIYFIIIVLAFYTVQTLLDVPYTALGAEMTLDYDERSSLNSYRTMFANFASVLGAFGIFLAIYFEGMTGSETLGWSLMAAVFGLLALISIFIGWKYTAGYERFQNTEITHFSLKEVFNGPLKNKSFLIIAVIFALGVMAQTITDGASIYYFFYNMELTEDNVSFLYALLWTAGMIWVPVIEKLATKFSKKTAWIISLASWGLAAIIFTQFLNDSMGLAGCFIMFGIAGLGATAIYQLAWSMIPDTVEIDEFKTGKRREGLYYGVTTFIQKASAAITLFIVGMSLDKIGYNADLEVQTTEALSGIKNIYGYGVLIVTLISVVVVLKYPLTKKVHEKLLDAIKLKKEGKDVDQSEIAKLL